MGKSGEKSTLHSAVTTVLVSAAALTGCNLPTGSATATTFGSSASSSPTSSSSSNPVACLSNSNWLASDDSLYPGGVDTSFLALASDSNGNVYVAGQGQSTSSQPIVEHGIVQKSSDHGKTWAMIGDDVGAVYEGLGVDPAGNLYALGYSGNDWIVNKSSNQGTTWSAVDSYAFLGIGVGSASGFAADTSGDLFVVGYSGVNGLDHFLVRKSSNQGATWATVDDFVSSAGEATDGRSIAIDSSGNIYAGGGYAAPSPTVVHAIIRKSTDSGKTWKTVEDYGPATYEQITLTALGKDLAGNIYWSGFAYPQNTTLSHAIVQKSSDQGATWNTVEDFTYTANQSAAALAFGNDAAGNIYWGGWGFDGAKQHYVVRKSADHGTTWTTVDDNVYGTGVDNPATAFTIDPLGNLYTAGLGYILDGAITQIHGIVRTLQCQ